MISSWTLTRGCGDRDALVGDLRRVATAGAQEQCNMENFEDGESEAVCLLLIDTSRTHQIVDIGTKGNGFTNY